jgi:uncharacterized membrane protein
MTGNRTHSIRRYGDRLANDRRARRAARTAMRNASAIAHDVRSKGVRDAARSRATSRRMDALADALNDFAKRADAVRHRRWPWLLGLGALGAGAAATVSLRRSGELPIGRAGDALVVVRAIDVDVPVREAYNQWTQFEEFPQFMGGIDEVRQLDDTHLRWRARVGRTERQWTARVTEQHPDERVAWTSTDGGPDGVVTFHRLDESRCRVTVQMGYQPAGVRDQVGHLIGVDSLRVQQDLVRFKQLIERRGSASGAWRGEVSATR